MRDLLSLLAFLFFSAALTLLTGCDTGEVEKPKAELIEVKRGEAARQDGIEMLKSAISDPSTKVSLGTTNPSLTADRLLHSLQAGDHSALSADTSSSLSKSSASASGYTLVTKISPSTNDFSVFAGTNSSVASPYIMQTTFIDVLPGVSFNESCTNCQSVSLSSVYVWGCRGQSTTGAQSIHSVEFQNGGAWSGSSADSEQCT